MADEKLMDAPTGLDLALRQLEWSLDALVVQPLGDVGLARPGVILAEGDTSSGYTCNFKCGDTAYWECPPFTTGSTCTASCDGTCNPSGTPYCQTVNATSPCACWGQSDIDCPEPTTVDCPPSTWEAECQ